MQSSNLDNMRAPARILSRVANSARTLCTSCLSSPNPKQVQVLSFAVTYQCNSKCSHCNIWKRYKETPNDLEKELTLNQIEHLLYHSQYLANLKKVVLAGGEPFLRADFVELCNLFTRRYPHAQITIPTNAVDPVLVASKLQEIKHAYDNKGVFLSVSLDGIGNKHDQFRGTPDNFENALQLLEYVRDSLATVGLGVSFTITPANFKELHDVYKLSKKMHADFNCQFAHKSQTYYGNTDITFEWTLEELEFVKKTLTLIVEDLTPKHRPFNVKNDPRTYYFTKMVNSQIDEIPYRCYSGTHSAFLDPYGNIYPCIMLNAAMGNITESPFDEIWFSAKTKEIRQFIGERKCSCWLPGEIIPSLYRNRRLVFFHYLNRLESIVRQ